MTKFIEELSSNGFLGNIKPNENWINSRYNELSSQDEYLILSNCVAINFQDSPLTDFMSTPDEEDITSAFKLIQEWLSETFCFDNFSVSVLEEERFNLDFTFGESKYSIKDGDLNAVLWILSALLNKTSSSGNSFFLTQTCQLFYCSSSAKVFLEKYFTLEDLSRHKKYVNISS